MTETSGADRPEEPGVPDAPDGLALFDAPPPAVPGDEPAPLAYAEAPPDDAPLAHPITRAFAFFLDGVATFVLVVVLVFAGLAGEADLFAAILLVPLGATVLDTVLTALFGVTPAKAILGIRVIDADSGAPIGFGRAILRSLVIVAPIALGLGLTALLTALPDELQFAFGGNLFLLSFLLPIAGWVALLVVLATRPRHRGLQDLAGRSVVVRR